MLMYPTVFHVYLIFQAGSFNAPALSSYYNKTFTSSRTALIGIGIDAVTLQEYAKLINMESGQGE